jgi:hypothetical protein
MKRPSQIYRQLKLWEAGLGVAHKLLLIVIAAVTLAGAVGITYPY